MNKFLVPTMIVAVLNLVGCADPVNDGKISLFNGKDLDGWAVSDFDDSGPINVKDGCLIIGTGKPMSGVNWTGDFPKINYEVTYEAKRVKGSDFFCGLTFPVGKDHCSFIVGGWGGSLVGLSCIDGCDASENFTGFSMNLVDNRWYKFRLRVTKTRIVAMIDGKEIINVDHETCRISIRIDVEDSLPFGFATWETTGAIRNINLRKFPETLEKTTE